MNSGKWYIRFLIADDCDISVVYLTEDEYNAVCKFTNNAKSVDSCNCGYSCSISNVGFDTEEEAIAHIVDVDVC